MVWKSRMKAVIRTCLVRIKLSTRLERLLDMVNRSGAELGQVSVTEEERNQKQNIHQNQEKYHNG